MQRLSKILSSCGVCARRKAEELIFEGRVTVNGQQILKPQEMFDPQKDSIVVDGKKIETSTSCRYFVLNKPKGFICSQATDIKRRAVDLIETAAPLRLYTIGRLDKDTEGLLILTNDGTFAHRLMHPSFEVDKEYLAKVDQEILFEHLEKLSKGCFIEGSWVKPLKVKKVRHGTVKITLAEGKKHEVRLLLARVGLEVVALTRIRIGALSLGKLPLGAFYELSKQEAEKLFPHAFKK